MILDRENKNGKDTGRNRKDIRGKKTVCDMDESKKRYIPKERATEASSILAME